MIDGVPVIYSLGNFWFSSSTLDTGLARVTIDEHGDLTLDFIPCIQKNLRTELITEETEKQRVFAFMQKHSAPGIVVTEEGIVRQEN
jgi:poly-gamma-glutamate synthesis protein (capsule biosynthesis protein)